jgi:hypothetical protein
VSVIDEIARVRDKKTVLDGLRSRVAATRAAHGEVYVIDLTAYPDHVSWLTTQTGLDRADLSRFETQPAFACEGIQFRRIVALS